MSGREFSVMLGKAPDGQPKPVETDEEGALKVSTTGPDGAELAKEATLAQLASTVQSGLPLAEDPAMMAYIKGGEVVSLPGQTFGSAAAAAASGSLEGVFIANPVDQGAAGVDPWATTDAGTRGEVINVKLEVQGLRTDVADDATTADIQAVEAELQDKATEATAAATLAAVDTLEANTDQVETKLDTISGTLGDRRTSDAPTGTGGQVVRPIADVCEFNQTTPGSPTFYLQVRNAPGRLKSAHIVNQSPGLGVHLFVCDVANYLPPPAGQPAVTTRRLLGFVDGSNAGVPSEYTFSFDETEMAETMFDNGILLVATTSATTTPIATATTATIAAMVWHKAAT